MPLNNPAPNFALLSSFNARTWSGVNVFSRGATNVTLPTFSTGAGIYEDAISFLNGRGSKSGFSSSDLLQAASNFGSNWSVSINSFDKVLISCDTAFKIRHKSDSDVLGVGSSTFSSAFITFTSPNNWTRGNIETPSVYEIQDTAGSNTFSFNLRDSLPAQDLIVAIRERATTNDLDDINTTDNLEYLDQTANGEDQITWFLNDSGHVVCNYPNTEAAVTWISTSFRDRLGFSGSEVPSGSLRKTLTADYPLPGSLFPSRPYQSHHLQTDTLTQARRKIGGGYTSNFIGSYVQSVLRFDLDAILDEKDLYRHFTNNFAEYIPSGERINFYQDYGDSRRALITSGVSSTQPNYDLLYTSEDNGDRGRIRASVLNNGQINLVYPSRLRRKVPVTLTFEHL